MKRCHESNPRRIAASRLLVGAAIALMSFGPAYANPILYGSLSNFDCINDTGQTAHGFEIELEGCLTSDVLSTFGAPYNRYGEPTITTDGVKTFVRYQSAYDTGTGTWAAGTDSGTYSPTDGHSLFFPQYGGTANYPNVPGDHFGVALSVTPTNTVYRWLLDGGGGNLVAAGTNVKMPAPILSVSPPANPGNAAAVQAIIQAPPPEEGQEFGEAIWAKVFITEVENPDPIELSELVLGNPVVPPDSETEIEWFLLQSVQGRPDLAEQMDEGDVANGNEAVTRRYEFYSYTGGYDFESHEALHDSYDPAYVGDFLGNQNVAANLAPIPEPSTVVLSAIAALALAWRSLRRKR